MKKLLLAATCVLVAASSFAQGTLTFNNNGSTALTNSSGGFAPNGTSVGLYYSSTAGTPESAMNRAYGPGGSGNVSTNIVFNGQFFGNARSINGVVGGETVFVQVRAWTGAFATYEDASLAALGGNPAVLLGKGNVFPLALGGGTTPTPSITGTGRLTQFGVSPPVPEPSSIVLGLLGLGAIVLFRRRK